MKGIPTSSAALIAVAAVASISPIGVCGWIHSPPTSSFRSSLHSRSSDNEIDVAGISSVVEACATSRRQWLGTLATAAAAIACAPASANAAATLVSTTTVCDPTVSVWSRDGRIVYLLGTAHVSAASAQLASNLVKDIHPNAVFVELDAKRIGKSGILANRVNTDDDSGDDTVKKSSIVIPNLTKLAQQPALAAAGDDGLAAPAEQPAIVTEPKQRGRNPLMRAATIAVGNGIKGMYKKLDSAGLNAGEEFVLTMQEAQNIGADIILGDRDVEVTLRRVTEGLAQTDLAALMSPDSELEKSMAELNASNMNSNALGDPNDPEYRSEFTSFVEVLKTKENVKKIMGQLQKSAPALYEALVSERDMYMAAGLNGLNDYDAIVAVMGIAHVDGVETNLQRNGWKMMTPMCSVPVA